MKIAIVYNKYIQKEQALRENLKSLFADDSEITLVNSEEMTLGYDFVFAVGGDGTILNVSKFYALSHTPVMGINLGRLGFLAQSDLLNLESLLSDVRNGIYKTETRSMLKFDNNFALNDFVIKGDFSARTSRFALEINGKFVCEYLADGIIISTPTGSTAYGMAAGGPVLAPDVDAIVIVPICPHTFSARPIVVAADDEIKILPCKNNEYNVSADGQIAFSWNKELVIKRTDKKANLALLNENDFYTVLRNKLHWGISPAKI